MATHSSILAWRIPGKTEEPGGRSPWVCKELDTTKVTEHTGTYLNHRHCRKKKLKERNDQRKVKKILQKCRLCVPILRGPTVFGIISERRLTPRYNRVNFQNTGVKENIVKVP